MFVYNELLGGPRTVLLYPTADRSNPVRGAYTARSHSCEQLYLGVLDGQRWSTPSMTAQVAALLQGLTAAAAK